MKPKIDLAGCVEYIKEVKVEHPALPDFNASFLDDGGLWIVIPNAGDILRLE